MTTVIQMIPVDLIDPHPKNPRHDLGNLAELVKSIKAQGIRQNLLLVPTCSGCPDDDGVQRDPWRCTIHGDKPLRYTAVIGHRRLAAGKKAGLKEVPAVVAELTEAEQLELMLVENVQRSDLSAVEEAEGYQGLLDLGLSAAAIAKTTGRAEKTVQSRVKLLALPEVAKAKVHAQQATLEDAGKLADFAGDAETTAKLADALGTTNFSWYLNQARADLKRRADQDELAAAARELGATELTADEPGDENDDVEWVERRIQNVEQLTEVSAAFAHRQGHVPAGARFERSRYGTEIVLLIPDPTGGIKTAEQAAAKAEREAKAAEAEQARQDRETGAKLREEWDQVEAAAGALGLS